MKILVVDDVALVRMVLERELKKGGYEVILATNGMEGIQKLEENPDVDLIVLDVEMPYMNGFETYEEINRRWKDREYTVFFFSGTDKSEYRKKGFELGATDFFKKNFEEGDFLLAVNKFLKPTKRFEGTTALVVDDMGVARKILKRILKPEGIKVLTASDGQEAYDLFKKHHDEIEIIITDNLMPNVTGMELTKMVRSYEYGKEVPILLLTSTYQLEMLMEFFNTGGTDYIVRPFLHEELLSRVYSRLEVFTLRKNLRANIAKYMEMNKLKDQFLSLCSHDFRSPVHGILGFSDILLKDTSLDEEQQEMVEGIKNSGEYLLALVNDLLDLRRVERNSEYSMQEISIDSFIRESIAAMQGAAHLKQIDIKYEDRTGGKAIIVGDMLALSRAMSNLLSNAIKFTPRAGSIDIRVKEHQKNAIAIEVQDSGVGIAADKIGSLFKELPDKSNLGTDGEQGSGLGLSIVKTVVEKHLGKVSAESDGKNGATFTIFLPSKVSLTV